MKTMKLKRHGFEPNPRPGEFRVQYVICQVTNSIEPVVGEILTTDEAAVYCQSDAWNVTID